MDYSNLPIYIEIRQSDMRIVAYKSAGLTAQNFMISVVAINYDTCPMEDFDSLRIKKILHLPASSEMTMIIGVVFERNKAFMENVLEVNLKKSILNYKIYSIRPIHK